LGERKGVKIIEARVSTYEEAIEHAIKYIKQRYENVKETQVERAYMQPHYEEGLWVVDLIIKTKPTPLTTQHRKIRITINPETGETKEQITI